MKRSQAGSTIVSALMGYFLTGAAVIATLNLLESARRAERGIDSNLTLLEISTALNQMFKEESTCAQSGLLGLQLNLASPATLPVNIAFPQLQENTANGSRFIDSVRFVKLEPLGPIGANTLYFATLKVQTSTVRKAVSMRKPSVEVYVKLLLDPDPGNHVLKCFQRSSTSVIPGQMCPGAQVILGIADDGTLLCGTDESTPDFISGLVALQTDGTTKTIVHNLGTMNYRIVTEVAPTTILYSGSCPSGSVYFGKQIDTGQEFCATSIMTSGAAQDVLFPPKPSPFPSPFPLPPAGVVSEVKTNNFIWTNKTENTVDVQIVGDSWNVAGRTNFTSIQAAKRARVRLFKY